MYADDSTLYTTGKCFADITRSLTTNSKPLYECVDGYCMVLNADKTECMILGTRKKMQCANAKFSVRSNKYVVTPVTTHKLFGCLNMHVTKLCSKLRSRMYLFIHSGETNDATTCTEVVFYRNGATDS